VDEFESGTDDQAPIQLGEPESARPQSLRSQIMGAIALLVIGGWILFAFYSDSYNPVSTYRLGSVLPRASDGWKLSRLSTSNPSRVEVGWSRKNLSSVSRRTYTQGGKEITIEIWDWAGAYPYHMPIDIPGWMNGEEVRIGAETGRLRYDTESRKGRLRVRYLDRFYIVVEGENIDRSDLTSWYHRIDFAGLRRELAELQDGGSSR
jgi:hypothetical protein